MHQSRAQRRLGEPEMLRHLMHNLLQLDPKLLIYRRTEAEFQVEGVELDCNTQPMKQKEHT